MRGHDNAVALCRTRGQPAGSAAPCRAPCPDAQLSARHPARPTSRRAARRLPPWRCRWRGSSGKAARSRVKHPRLQVAGLGGGDIAGIEIDRVAAVAGKRAGECVRVGPGPPQRVARGRLRHQKRQPGRNDLRRMPVVFRISAADSDDAGGGLLGGERCADFLKPCGAVSSAPTTPAAARSGFRPARGRLSPQTTAAPAALAACVASTKAVPTLGWPANGISGADREDANLRVMRGVLRRQHEGRLGIIELGRNGLHLRGRQSAGIRASPPADCRRRRGR